MSSAKKWFLFFCVVSMATLILLPPTTTHGAPKWADADEDKASDDDIFVVPKGGPKKMIAYLKKLQKSCPNPRRDRRGYIQFLTKSAKPKLEAANRILESDKATKKQKKTAAVAKFSALNILLSLRDPDALKALKAMPDELTELGLDDLAMSAKSKLLSMELRNIASKKSGARDLSEVIAEIKQIVTEKPNQGSFRLAYSTVSVLQMMGKNEKAALLCDNFAEIFSASDSSKVKELAKRFKAIGRRMRLLGNPMKVEGVLLDGKPFDWSDYKGKVVLVQFWATWCGYCVREIPNIEKCYDKYHDRGFDVVSISLDRSREALEGYLDKHPVPWPVLYDEDERNPTADYYGVTGLPTLILVGKDGNVVSLNARGKVLEKELKKLFGSSDKDKGDDES